MGNVFTNPYKQAPEVWSAQQATITWGVEAGGQGAAGNNPTSTDNIFAALNQVQISYQRQVTTQYPIGGSKPIQLLGAPQGTLVLSTLIGPDSTMDEFLKAIASPCKSLVIQVLNSSKQIDDENCKNTAAKAQSMLCRGCVANVVSYQLSMDPSGMAIATGTFQFTFTNMEWTSNNA